MRASLRIMPSGSFLFFFLLGFTAIFPARVLEADEGPPAERIQALDKQLRALDVHVIPADQQADAARMLERQINARLRAAGEASTRDWYQIDSRAAWQQFRDAHVKALRDSLGHGPDVPAHVEVRRTGTIAGDGFAIDKLLYESRPGYWVSANLYRPLTGERPRPAIVLAHSHHSPKTEGELQTMGMTWARLGAYVLVPDQVGHGELREHPFRTDDDYPGPFKRSRQDYYFRYDVSLQLYLVGDSLMGWMAWDLMRGLDVLLMQPQVDREKTIILGSVAGGGDIAAVTAALDPRFAAAAVFNFGGPQPEDHYPLPEDSETHFNFTGGGGWESTRNLNRTAANGCLPWVIDASLAPRRLIYGHEFRWDQPHDPVWKRLEQIYAWYDTPDRLAFTHGEGGLQGRPPEATHCNNIGAPHRRLIYPALEKWFGMPGGPDQEYSKTRPAADLQCWTPEMRDQLKPKLVRELAASTATRQVATANEVVISAPAAQRRALLKERWARVLGNVEPAMPPKERSLVRYPTSPEEAVVEGVVLDVEDDIRVPLLLILPAGDKPAPVVVAVAQQGSRRLLIERHEIIARLLADGIGVCLVDVRGCGETAPEDHARDRPSAATSLSASELMLGGTLLGARLRDMRSALQYLRTRKNIDSSHLALWGDSLAEVNPPDRRLVVPQVVDNPPPQAEPLGGLIVTLTTLWESDLRAVYVHRGLVNYVSALELPVVYLPHDVIVPGAIEAGDLPLLTAQLAPLPLRLDEMIDATNRRVPPQAFSEILKPIRESYRAQQAEPALMTDAPNEPAALTAWFVTQLRAK